MLPLLPDPVDCPALPLVEPLLCAIANAPAATNTKRIPGNFFILVSIVFKVLRSPSPPLPLGSRPVTAPALNTSLAVIESMRKCRQIPGFLGTTEYYGLTPRRSPAAAF